MNAHTLFFFAKVPRHSVEMDLRRTGRPAGRPVVRLEARA